MLECPGGYNEQPADVFQPSRIGGGSWHFSLVCRPADGGGFNPLLQMFWDPGLTHLPLWDGLVLLLSWFVTMLFFHFVLFSLNRIRHRQRYC